MKIGPRTGEVDNRFNHYWWRKINGTRYHFIHVKVTRFGEPYVMAANDSTGELVRCTCPRTDCPTP
ncbi:hypothetical protein ACH4F6_38055 [Streptomyces sp. NPDC017936]|uniref:hypothetical protein n=1 Tax=Streptomyces sp. NPDC017936 TaxID=3365016 RepID=UPI0037BBD4CE